MLQLGTLTWTVNISLPSTTIYHVSTVPDYRELKDFVSTYNISNPIYTVLNTLSIMPADFVTTIDSDDEVSNYGGESSKPTPSKSKKQEDEELDPDFEFDFGGGGSAGIDLWGGDEVRVGDKGKEVCLLCAIRRIRAS